MTAAEMVSLPWAWMGPTPSTEDDDEVYFELRIRELPGFFVAARTAKEARAMAAPALEAFLQAVLAQSHEPPVPEAAEHNLRSHAHLLFMDEQYFAERAAEQETQLLTFEQPA